LIIAGALDHGGGLPQPSKTGFKKRVRPQKSWSRGGCTS
jgi:hypothetical protein